MLRIELAVGESGVLRDVVAEGHTGYAERGRDIVCAAASVLLRTAARTFEAADGYEVVGSAQYRGRMQFSVRAGAENAGDWARGVTEMLLEGIADLAREFPDHVEVNISRPKEKTYNGT